MPARWCRMRAALQRVYGYRLLERSALAAVWAHEKIDYRQPSATQFGGPKFVRAHQSPSGWRFTTRVRLLIVKRPAGSLRGRSLKR